MGDSSRRRERMSKPKNRVFTREFKLSAVQRMLSGETVRNVCRELNVLRKDLYRWRKQFRSGGPDALFPRRGRPPKGGVAGSGGARATNRSAVDSALTAARARIAELERKVGQQQTDIDFFRAALRQ